MSHDHKYFPMDKMATFEPLTFSLSDDSSAEVGEFVHELSKRDLYERVEYVIMTCNCGDVIKKKVRDE